MNIRLNLAILATALVCAVQAAVSFTYQGVLKDAQGKALSTKNQTVSFRLYNSPSGTEVLWGRSISVLLDDAGLFNVELSDSNGGTITAKYSTLKEALMETANSTLYIGVQVGGSSEIRPRQRILSVPFATIAGDVKSTSGSLSVGGQVVATGAQINGSTSVTGTTQLGKGLTVSGGETSLGSKLTVKSGGMTVTGTATFNDVVTMKSSLAAKSISIDGSPVSIAKVGMIMMWYGKKADVPAGWKICDGSNGTPNLQGMFVAGANSDANSGDYGVMNTATRGANSVTLTTSQIPSHTHVYYSDDQLNSVQAAISGTYQQYAFDFGSDDKKRGSKYNTFATGGGGSHENRPAFKALYYIMYVGVK